MPEKLRQFGGLEGWRVSPGEALDSEEGGDELVLGAGSVRVVELPDDGAVRSDFEGATVVGFGDEGVVVGWK